MELHGVAGEGLRFAGQSIDPRHEACCPPNLDVHDRVSVVGVGDVDGERRHARCRGQPLPHAHRVQQLRVDLALAGRARLLLSQQRVDLREGLGGDAGNVLPAQRAERDACRGDERGGQRAGRWLHGPRTDMSGSGPQSFCSTAAPDYNRRPMNQLFRRKPVADLVSEGTSSLRRTLGPIQLTALGVGAIIGAGIFSTVGTAAAGGADHIGAGPAIILSFVLTGIACGFAALCYAEFAAMVPIAGSAYTYSYATLGELVAWIIGWDLIIEYAIGNVAVAISWSGYFQELLNGFGLHIPAWLGVDYRTAAQAAAKMAEAAAAGTNTATLGASVVQAASALSSAPHLLGIPIGFNLPAFLIVALVTVVLVKGVNESAWTNTAMVALKIVIIVFFLAMGAFYVKPENWHPFAPNGFAGVSSAA